MVNSPDPRSPERRERQRPAKAGVAAGAAGVLGQPKLNPFGDLHTLQHLCARLARSLRGVWEPLLRREVRSWAEPLSVQRFADYRAERPDRLTAWLPVAMGQPGGTGGGRALMVLDGRFVLEVLDLFFGGAGVAPQPLPAEFSPAADAVVARLGRGVAGPLAAAWEPLARAEFQVGHPEANPAMLGGLDADDAVVVTRFGVAAAEGGGDAPPVFLDILYAVAGLKPFAPTLTGKVLDKAEPDAGWRTALTRAAMGVRFPVRSVLAEPVVPLSLLMNLKPGDVIPIQFGAEVPVMVGADRLGAGAVGVSNGRAAVRLTSLAIPEGFDR